MLVGYTFYTECEGLGQGRGGLDGDGRAGREDVGVVEGRGKGWDAGTAWAATHHSVAIHLSGDPRIAPHSAAIPQPSISISLLARS
jgi:hypothetical protein